MLINRAASSGGGSPTGSAGGALGGTYPNPTLADTTSILAATNAADNQGYLSQSLSDIALATAQFTLATAGTVYLAKIPWPYQSKALAEIHYNLVTNGATLTANQNFVVAYHSSGAVLGTFAADAQFVSGAGEKTATIAVSAGSMPSAGFFWAGFVFNGATGPTLSRAANTTPNGLINTGLSNALSRFGTGTTGVTTVGTVVSITPSSITQGGGQSLWVAAK